MRELGVLENAFEAAVKRRVNEVWTASFSLPADDPKNELCKHFNYIDIYGDSDRYYGLYRIMPTETKKSERDNTITYKLQHVLSTLMDDVIDGLLPALINRTTRENLQRLLDLQTTKHWVLGEVQFERYFQYAFENENGLLAPILSIPKPFDEPYEFTFDTKTYPWKLNLIRPDNAVKSEIRWGKDMIDFSEVSDPTNIVNYIIPKGAGEGVNQLSIESVNDGKRFLKDDESIAKWGKKPYIWIDQRFSDPESLKANAQSLLNQWKDPAISFSCTSVDLSLLPEYKNETKILNGVTRIIVEDKEYEARIIGEDFQDVLGREWDVKYEINNQLDDIATTQADLERKMQVNEAYSQGATNIMNFTYQDNCDQNIPALIPIYIDDDVVNINTCELTFRTKKFRAYSRATKSAGQIVKSITSGGGGATVKSSTTSAGGGTQQTASAGGNHRHLVALHSSNSTSQIAKQRYYFAGSGTGGNVIADMEGAPQDLYTFGASGNHTHPVTIPPHQHGFEFQLDNHTHPIQINIEGHEHDVEHEIIELNTIPDRMIIKVDGNTVNFSGTSGDRINLIPYLSKDQDGKVRRGRHEITIQPNGLARIEADVILRVFIQSRLGGIY